MDAFLYVAKRDLTDGITDLEMDQQTPDRTGCEDALGH